MDKLKTQKNVKAPMSKMLSQSHASMGSSKIMTYDVLTAAQCVMIGLPKLQLIVVAGRRLSYLIMNGNMLMIETCVDVYVSSSEILVPLALQNSSFGRHGMSTPMPSWTTTIC